MDLWECSFGEYNTFLHHQTTLSLQIWVIFDYKASGSLNQLIFPTFTDRPIGMISLPSYLALNYLFLGVETPAYSHEGPSLSKWMNPTNKNRIRGEEFLYHSLTGGFD